MTEMLHIFLSNRPGQVRPGTTGVAVPGYDLRMLDDDGREVEPGTPGTLFVRGASTATGYWSRYDASRQVFQGEWLRTGDTYVQDADGYYLCLGRTGDMLKASGIWVSPAEVEARLLAHDAVAQAVVVAATDADGLEKPVAYVVPRAGAAVDEDELIAFTRAALPSFKRPRKVIFVDGYPTTATGKIRRVELRAMAATVLTGGTGRPSRSPTCSGCARTRRAGTTAKQRLFGDRRAGQRRPGRARRRARRSPTSGGGSPTRTARSSATAGSTASGATPRSPSSSRRSTAGPASASSSSPTSSARPRPAG